MAGPAIRAAQVGALAASLARHAQEDLAGRLGTAGETSSSSTSCPLRDTLARWRVRIGSSRKNLPDLLEYSEVAGRGHEEDCAARFAECGLSIVVKNADGVEPIVSEITQMGSLCAQVIELLSIPGSCALY